MPLLGKKGAAKGTRLFFATDVHGSDRSFRKFVNAGKFYDVSVLVMGGDIIGKLAIPIIRGSNGHYRATLQGTTEHFETEQELEGLLTKSEPWASTARSWMRTSSGQSLRTKRRWTPCFTSWPGSDWSSGSI